MPTYDYFFGKETFNGRYKLYWPIQIDGGSSWEIYALDPGQDWDGFEPLEPYETSELMRLRVPDYSVWPETLKPMAWDPKYPNGGSVDFPYGTAQVYHDVLEQLPSTLPIKQAYEAIVTRADPSDPRNDDGTEDLKQAFDLLVHSTDPYGEGPTQAAEACIKFVNWAVGAEPHTTVPMLQAALPEGLPSRFPWDDKWYEGTALAWHAKLVYGFLAAKASQA